MTLQRIWQACIAAIRAWFGPDAKPVTELHVDTKGRAPGEFFDYVWQERPCFGTFMSLGRRTVYIDISHGDRLDERKAAALALLASTDVLSRNFYEFKRAQMTRQSQYATEIERLQIGLISFHSVARANAGAVSFTDTSGGRDWHCDI